MNVWILGASGQLGKALINRCRCMNISFVASSRADADVTDLDALKKGAEGKQFTHLINCAAFTDVDLAEELEQEAYEVNARGAENVAIVGREMGIKVVHVSTDYVFDGKSNRPYTEKDLPSPINVYGQSKLEGERRVLYRCPNACIVRTSWIFGELSGGHFISSIFDRLKKQRHIDAVDDQKGCVTYNRDLTRALLALSYREGIYHFVNSGEVSRFEILKNFYCSVKQKGIAIKCQTIAPVSLDHFPTVSKRPTYSVLSTEKVGLALGRKPRTWKNALNEYLNRLFQIS